MGCLLGQAWAHDTSGKQATKAAQAQCEIFVFMSNTFKNSTTSSIDSEAVLALSVFP
jgi:hypothetical protein